MTIITKNLTKSIKDILYYKKDNSIEDIIKIVFETILQLERSNFLLTSENNKGNGYYPRLLKSINNYFKLQIPRDRLGFFKPVFLDLLREEESKAYDLAFKLYVKGLTTREISDIFNDVFSHKISASSVSNISKQFQEQRDLWLTKPLESEYYFIYIDALFVPVRRNTVSKEAFYTVIGLRKDLKREVLGLYNIPTESASGWGDVFKDLKKRGLEKVLMVVADGITNLENVVEKELPCAQLQKCLVHKIRDIVKRVRSSHKKEISEDFREVFVLETDSETIETTSIRLNDFINKWKDRYSWIKNKFKYEHMKYYCAYLKYPGKIQRMIYTTNWVERLNKAIRRTQKMRGAMPSPESAMNLIAAYLMGFEEKTYSYPVTAFSSSREKLDMMLE